MCILWGWGARGIDIMEQKKFIYEGPQMEVVEMKMHQALLTDSEFDPGTGGAGSDEGGED